MHFFGGKNNIVLAASKSMHVYTYYICNIHIYICMYCMYIMNVCIMCTYICMNV